jgi:hypothetical protein
MILRAPLLYQQFRDGVRTDLSLEQLLQLATMRPEHRAEND